MKRNYILIVLLCFLIKNVVEYNYNGPNDVGFGIKWKTIVNVGTKNIDNVLEKSLIDVESKEVNDKEMSKYADKTIDYTSPTLPLKDIEGSSASNSYASNNVGDNYAVTGNGSPVSDGGPQPTQNFDYAATTYGNNNSFLASNGISNSHGPSNFGATDVAINGGNNGPQWGGNEVGLMGNMLPGGGAPLPDVPIDGGLSILLVAAIGKGVKSLRTKKKTPEKNMRAV